MPITTGTKVRMSGRLIRDIALEVKSPEGEVLEPVTEDGQTIGFKVKFEGADGAEHQTFAPLADVTEI